MTAPKQFYSRTILLFILAFAMGRSQVYAQCTDQCPIIAGVNINSCVGIITINVTGNAPFTYDWRDSGGNQVSTSFIASGLIADNYTVTVTDVDGDTETATYTVTNPPNLVGSVVVNDVTCRGDSDAQVIVTMSNGNPTYDWELFNGGGNSIGTGSAPAFSNVITLGGLGIGNYTLTVTDANGCTGDITFTITQPANFLGFSIGSSTDATCFNSSDGSISATGTGGWGNYVYQWIRVSDGVSIGNTATINGLPPGDYQLIIVDRNGTGCTISTPIQTIGSPPEIIQSAAISDALCNGNADGSINLSVSGGVGPYSYSWSNGETSQDISGLAAGNYTVTITDNAGCTDVATYTVGEPLVLTINPDIRDVSCFGDNTGRIRSNVTGGTEPYTYSWSTGNTGRNLTNRIAGTYSLTVTDANGCTVSANGLVISEPAAPLSKLSEAMTDPSCFGGNDGSVTINMQGGTAPYTYSWSNGDNTATASNLTAGNHTVTVTDNNGCTYVETFTLNDPIRIAVSPSLTLPSCNGGADGAITVVASNGTGPYVYNWNTGASGATIGGLVAGTYTVTVTDNNGAGCTVVESITLGEPSVLVSNATVNNISCNGAGDGSIFLSASGGTGPYTYLWNTGATTNNLTGLNAGAFSVTITDSKGCSITDNFNIVDPAVIGLTYTQTDILCKGASTGILDITPTGGTLPYTYLWSNGSTAQDLTNVPAGTYTVTIRDASNCSVGLTVTITEPATVMTLSGAETNATCAGSDNGSIDLTVVGGSAPYTYSWNTGATTEDVTGLAPGNYSVSVTDAVGCIKSIGFTITEPSPISASETLSNVSCNGANDGEILISIGGGTGPYTYAWADDGSITTKDRAGLGPGNYTLTVTDASGCTYVETFNITEPAILSSTATQLNVSCFGESTGSINLSVSGGSTPYNFLWSNGALTEDLVNIPAGNYSVVITDANGCTDSKSFTISEPPSALAVASSISQITCNGAADGIINLTVSGGSAPYSFNWSNGSTSEDQSNLPAGNYTVTVTDNNGCTYSESFTITDPPVLALSGVASDVNCNGAANGSIDITVGGGEGPFIFSWSNGESTEDLSNLGLGTYSVNISDARGCTISASYLIQEPTALGFSYTSDNVSCFGLSNGAIDITITGGTAPYTYSWSNGETTQDINSLNAGNYTVLVTDLLGCTLNETITITEPTAVLSATATVNNISCFGGSDGSIVLSPTGGTAPYTYAWNSGATTKDVFGLADGTYQVTITDANGCFIQESYTISMPTALLASGTQTNVLCNGEATGAIDLTVSGGNTPYNFTWSNGANTEDLTNITAGTYQVTISDAKGCSLVRSFTITQPLALLLGESTQDVSCFGASDGYIDLSVSGGIAPYTYSWSNGATTQDLFNISGGNYSVTITDGNGCSTIKNYSIAEPSSALSVTGIVTDEGCFGDSQGAIALTVSGGSAPYSFSWNQGATIKDLAGLTQGVYQVTVTDKNGCSIQSSFTVAGPAAITATASITNSSCNGADNGLIDLEVIGGVSPYTFAWGNGETSEDLNNLSPGNYSVVITDANGCSINKSYTITEPTALGVGFSVTDVNCFGANNGAISITPTGGTLPYSYAWSNGATSKNLSNLAGGDYTITITDGKFCTFSQTITVVEPAAPLSLSATIVNEQCFGDNQGNIDLTVTGGTAPYSYSWNNGSASQDILGLGRGDYQITVTDKNGCSVTSTYTISGPDVLSIAGSISPISCNGADDGALDVIVSGGTGPYTYSWSSGENVEDIAALAPGTYSLTVTDANGCSANRTWSMTEPLPLIINYTTEDVTCFGADDGQIKVAVSGGTLPYDYSWSNGSNKKDLTGLAGGTYELTVTDARGCQQQTQVLIKAPSAALSATATMTDAICNGQPNAKIQLNVSGGTAPFNYLWSNGSNQRDLVNVFAGNYSVTITDAKGCVINENYTVGQPDALDVTFDITNSSCLGDTDGAVSITATGGNGPYSYVWSNGSTSKDLVNIAGGTYNVTITDAQGCSITRSVEVGDAKDLNVDIQKFDILCKGENTGQIFLYVTGGSGSYDFSWSHGATESDLTGLAAGVYSATITDTGGCSTSISVVISEPAEVLSVQLADFNDLLCFGDNSGTVKAITQGGVAPFTYLWSNGARTNQISNLTAGNYTVTVTDANGCVVQAQANIGQPDKPITITSQGKFNLNCKGDNDGRIVLDVEGGTGLYEFIWSTGATTSSIDNLEVGDYTVRVKDANGCVQERVFSIREPEVLSLENALVNESQCYDDRNGSIELNIQGGVEPYSYQWSTGSTNKNLIGISSGSYSVLVTDANGCQVQGNYNLAEPALFKVEPQMNEISCVGANDASISLNVQGGVGPVSIRWSNGASTETVTELGPGQYNVLVTDDKGCTIQQTFNIIEPLPLTLDAYIEDATRCNDPKSGLVNVIVSGGSEPYSYRWSNGATTSSIQDVLPGTYVVRVRDRYNCEVQGTYTVLQPEPLQIGLSTEPYIDCNNRIAGMLVKANVKGGVGNYSYSWSRGSSANEEVLLTEPGRLTIEVRDNRGCFQQNSIDIDVPELGRADFEYNAESIDRTGDLAANDPVSFFDLSIGEVIDWYWEFGDGFDSDEIDPIHTYDAPGTYTVKLVVTDRTGCKTEKISVLEITEGYRIIVPNAFTPNGDGNNDFFRPRMLGLVKAQLLIYNTWGEVIFNTKDIETKGWDGTINGRKAENGNYVYKIIGVSFNGLPVERDGIFALIN